MTTDKKLGIHLKNQHMGKLKEQDWPNFPKNTPNPTKFALSKMLIKYSTNEQPEYHEKNKNGYGNNYLVGKANFNSNLPEVYENIDPGEVLKQMEIGEFVSTLSRQQRTKFCNIIFKIEKSLFKKFL